MRNDVGGSRASALSSRSGLSEKVVMCAAKMYEARTALRRLFDDYDEKIEPCREILRKLSETRETVDVMIEILQDLDARGANGVHQMWILAASVDVMEEG